MRSPALAAGICLAVLATVAATASPQTPPEPRPSSSPPARTPALPPDPVELSVLTSPPGAHLTLTGDSDVEGQAPLDLPSLWTGRFSVTIEGSGVSKTQGVLYIPPRGGLAYALSEPPGPSIGLVIRSLNFPGLPAISSHHRARGGALAIAAVTAVGLGARAHIFYRNSLKDDDLDADARARDFKRSRDEWAGYLGAVWGLSAVDYWIRSRMSVLESTPSRVTIEAPTLSRTGVVWRSLLVPGAGQEFANRRGRALFWLGATLAAGAGYVVVDGIHHTDLTQLRQAERDLANADSAQAIALKRAADRRADDAQTSQDLRDGFRTAAFATYLANVFDSFVVPIGRSTERTPAPAKLSAVSRIHPRGGALALQYRF